MPDQIRGSSVLGAVSTSSHPDASGHGNKQYHVSPTIRQGLILIFAPKNTHIRAYFQGMFYFFHGQQSTFIQIQPCHLLLVAAQGWRVRFH